MATPAVIAGRVYTSQGFAATRTVSNVNTTGGTFLKIGVTSAYSDGSHVPTAVTFNGSATGIVLHDSQNTGETAAAVWWYYLNAPAETTANVVVTFNAGTFAVVIVEVWENTHATTPVRTAAKAASTNSILATVTCTTGQTGDVISDVCCGRRSADATNSLTVGAGQTQVAYNVSAASNTLSNVGASSTEPGSASVVMSWDLTTSDRWAIIAVPMVPSVDAGGRRERFTRGLHRGLSGAGA